MITELKEILRNEIQSRNNRMHDPVTIGLLLSWIEEAENVAAAREEASHQAGLRAMEGEHY